MIRHSLENGIRWFITSFFPTLAPLPHGQKSTRFNKTHISTRNSNLSEGNFSSIYRNNIGYLLLDTMADSTLWFTMLNNNIFSNPIPHIVLPFLLVPLHWEENVKRGILKGERQQLRNSKHKVKHKIECYPKSLMVFTAYQVQGWWTIIISPVKSQPDGINVREVLLNISWSTHLKHYNPCIFIYRKWRSLQMNFLIVYSLSQQSS